jgi:hypothetical protein
VEFNAETTGRHGCTVRVIAYWCRALRRPDHVGIGGFKIVVWWASAASPPYLLNHPLIKNAPASSPRSSARSAYIFAVGEAVPIACIAAQHFTHFIDAIFSASWL